MTCLWCLSLCVCRLSFCFVFHGILTCFLFQLSCLAFHGILTAVFFPLSGISWYFRVFHGIFKGSKGSRVPSLSECVIEVLRFCNSWRLLCVLESSEFTRLLDLLDFKTNQRTSGLIAKNGAMFRNILELAGIISCFLPSRQSKNQYQTIKPIDSGSNTKGIKPSLWVLRGGSAKCGVPAP